MQAHAVARAGRPASGGRADIKKNGDRPEGARSPFGKLAVDKLSGGLFGDANGLCGAEATAEFFDAARGIDEFLLAGEKGMAGGADADLEIAPGGAHVVNRAAGAGDGGLDVFWVNLCFHGSKRDVEATRFDGECNEK